jgi:hypothetical protein
VEQESRILTKQEVIAMIIENVERAAGHYESLGWAGPAAKLWREAKRARGLAASELVVDA